MTATLFACSGLSNNPRILHQCFLGRILKPSFRINPAKNPKLVPSNTMFKWMPIPNIEIRLTLTPTKPARTTTRKTAIQPTTLFGRGELWATSNPKITKAPNVTNRAIVSMFQYVSIDVTEFASSPDASGSSSCFEALPVGDHSCRSHDAYPSFPDRAPLRTHRAS